MLCLFLASTLIVHDADDQILSTQVRIGDNDKGIRRFVLDSSLNKLGSTLHRGFIRFKRDSAKHSRQIRGGICDIRIRAAWLQHEVSCPKASIFSLAMRQGSVYHRKLQVVFQKAVDGIVYGMVFDMNGYCMDLCEDGCGVLLHLASCQECDGNTDNDCSVFHSGLLSYIVNIMTSCINGINFCVQAVATKDLLRG